MTGSLFQRTAAYLQADMPHLCIMSVMAQSGCRALLIIPNIWNRLLVTLFTNSLPITLTFWTAETVAILAAARRSGRDCENGISRHSSHVDWTKHTNIILGSRLGGVD